MAVTDLDSNKDGKIDIGFIPDLSAVYQVVMGSDDNYVTDAQLTGLDAAIAATHNALTLGTTSDIFSLSTQQLNLDTQTAHYVFAGPTGGAAAAPTFRALVSGDIPDISSYYQVVMGLDDNYVTDAEKTVIGNTSGANSGDEVDFAGAGASGLVPDPVSEEGYALLDDGTFGLLSSANVSVDEISGLTATTVYGAIGELYGLIPTEVPTTHYAHEVVPVGWMVDGAAQPTAIDITTRKPFQYRTFTNSADKDLNFVWFVPSNMDATDLRVWFRIKYLITASTGPSATEDVAWGVSGVCAGDNDPSNYTKGTVATVTDADLNASQWDIMISDWTAVTISGLEPGGVAEINVMRDVSEGTVYAQLVGLIAVELRYVIEEEIPAA